MSKKNEIRDWVIYKITSPSGRVYIGKTVNFKNRIKQYRYLNCKDQKMLYNSFVKYGFDNHFIDIVDSFSSNLEYSCGKEMFWIRSYMSEHHKFKSQNGLNLTRGGDGVLGVVVSEESRRKSSENRKANITEAERQRLRDMSYISKGLPSPRLGCKHTDEVKKIISEFHKGKKWNLGKIRTDEMKEKYRQSSMGKSVGRKYEGEKLERIRSAGLSKGKPVMQYDLSGNFMIEYRSANLASIETGIPRTTVHHILNGTIPNPKRFIFKYKK